MKTSINWEAPTLKHCIDNGEIPSLQSENRGDKIAYKCPCGCFASSGSIVDLRAWENRPQDWACSGCTSKWKRELFSLNNKQYNKDKTKRKLEEKKWLKDWIEILGGPYNLLEQIDKKIKEIK